MSMIGMIQNFIGRVSETLKDNPFGLSKGQIDEINQILNLIKNILSDGIQRGDIKKLLGLFGEMVELMPEFSTDLKEIMRCLKKLAKKFAEDVDASSNLKPWPKTKVIEASDLMIAQNLDQMDMTADHPFFEDLSLTDDEFGELKNDIHEFHELRFDVAEQMLQFIEDKLILNQANFDELTKGLNRIKNRANFQNKPKNDYIVDGVSDPSFPIG